MGVLKVKGFRVEGFGVYGLGSRGLGLGFMSLGVYGFTGLGFWEFVILIQGVGVLDFGFSVVLTIIQSSAISCKL